MKKKIEHKDVVKLVKAAKKYNKAKKAIGAKFDSMYISMKSTKALYAAADAVVATVWDETDSYTVYLYFDFDGVRFYYLNHV